MDSIITLAPPSVISHLQWVLRFGKRSNLSKYSRKVKESETTWKENLAVHNDGQWYRWYSEDRIWKFLLSDRHFDAIRLRDSPFRRCIRTSDLPNNLEKPCDLTIVSAGQSSLTF
jgi:hypothetical protein